MKKLVAGAVALLASLCAAASAQKIPASPNPWTPTKPTDTAQVPSRGETPLPAARWPASKTLVDGSFDRKRNETVPPAFPGVGRASLPRSPDSVVLLAARSWDVESNRLSIKGPEIDFKLEMVSASERYLVPENGAKAAVARGRDFDSIDAAFVAAQRLTGPIQRPDSDRSKVRVVSALSAEVLIPGTIVVFQTAEGAFGKLMVEGYHALHDFSFPEAAHLSPAWREMAMGRPDIPCCHLQVRCVLLATARAAANPPAAHPEATPAPAATPPTAARPAAGALPPAAVPPDVMRVIEKVQGGQMPDADEQAVLKAWSDKVRTPQPPPTRASSGRDRTGRRTIPPTTTPAPQTAEGVGSSAPVAPVAGTPSNGVTASASGIPPSAPAEATPPARPVKDLGHNEQAARLATALAAATTEEQVRDIARTVLALAGETIYRSDGIPSVRGVAPLLPADLLEEQADALAHAHFAKQGRTVADLGELMGGFPVEGESPLFKTPGLFPQFLARYLEAWIEVAGERPDDPEAFAPLFLAELARRKTPSRDLRSIDDPADTEFSPLEVFLLSSAPLRGVSIPRGIASSAAEQRGRECPCFIPAACAAEPPPSPYRDWREIPEKVESARESAMAKKAIGEALGWLDKKFGHDPSSTDGFGLNNLKDLMRVYGWVATVNSYVDMYCYDVHVEPQPAKAHYVHADESEGPKKVAFVATVTATSRGSADKAQKATMKWNVIKGVPKHAQLNAQDFSKSGAFGKEETKAGNGKSVYPLDTTWETSKDVARYGKLKHDEIVMEVEVYTEGMTPTDVAIDAVRGKYKNAIKAWVDRWVPKKARGRMAIEYHKLPKYKFRRVEHIPGCEGEIVIEGTNRDDGPFGTWDITISGMAVLPGGGSAIYKGTETANISYENRGHTKGSMSVDSQSGGLNMHIDSEFSGDASIGGTPEAPTIVLSGYRVEASVDASGDYGQSQGKISVGSGNANWRGQHQLRDGTRANTSASANRDGNWSVQQATQKADGGRQWDSASSASQMEQTHGITREGKPYSFGAPIPGAKASLPPPPPREVPLEEVPDSK